MTDYTIPEILNDPPAPFSDREVQEQLALARAHAAEGHTDEVERICESLISLDPDCRDACLSWLLLAAESFAGSPDPDTMDGGAYGLYCDLRGGLIYNGGALVACAPWVERAILREGTAGIAPTAFRECSALTYVRISGGVRRLPKKLFYQCEQLETVELPEGLYEIGWKAFAECRRLVNIVLPESLTMIGEWAFASCESLREITVPSNVITPAQYMFRDCRSLRSVTLPASWGGISQGMFEGCTALVDVRGPLRLRYLDESCFWGCRSLADFPADDLFVIQDCAFSGCASLRPLTLPATLSTMGSGAFSGCPGELAEAEAFYGRYDDTAEHEDGLLYKGDHLVGVEGDRASLVHARVRAGTVTIGRSAFANCPKLTSVTLPASLRYIGEDAFRDCPLTTLTLPHSLRAIENHAFTGCLLTELVLPEGLLRLGKGAFSFCAELRSVTLPADLPSIPPSCFAFCKKLASLALPDRLRAIGSQAFWRCHSLTAIPHSPSLVFIDHEAFLECEGLVEVSVPSTVRRLGQKVFEGCPNLVSLTLPDSLRCICNIGEPAVIRSAYNLPDDRDNEMSPGNYELFCSEVDLTRQCPTITEITFGGTVERWERLSGGDRIPGVSVRCTDGVVEAGDK